jgi:Ca2+-binding EF-hand superfamily protein
LLDSLEQILEMEDSINIVTDMAFEAVDADGSGQLDKIELGQVLKDVAKVMNINPPSDNDVTAVLQELDQDDDAEVSKDEFVHLILQVLRKMKESEEEFQRTYQPPQ